VSPAGTETCNDLDDDCDGDVDEEAADASTWYLDLDGDGYGTDSYTEEACDAPSLFIDIGGDCDDDDASNNPDALESCDGEDNDCDGTIDEDDSTDASTFYADTDGDGFGDSSSTTTACDIPSGYAEDDTDCDDGDSGIHPEATEICGSGVDEDCTGTADDDDDQWWDEAIGYRIPIEVAAADTDVDGPPIVLSVDFADALDDLGESDDFVAESLRVVLQDCSLGLPELSSQFLDDVDGLMEKTDHEDGTGDGIGTVAFLYDTDGDITSLETLSAGTEVELALYFDTSGSDPGYSTGLLADVDLLSNDWTEAWFEESDGGLLDTLSFDGGSSVMSQTDSCCGNGVYTTSWYETPMYVTGELELLHEGPVVAILETTGVAGDYEYSYIYWMFDGRPELWSKTWHETIDVVYFDHPSDFADGIRPWESRQDNISSGATFETASDYTWSDVSNGTDGIAFGYHQAPDYVTWITNYDPYLIVAGSDFAPSGSGTSYSIPAGVPFLDHVVMLVLPHDGAFADVEDTLYGLMDGVETRQGAPEAL
jgi:hypothetical protein